jgi:RNA polymerase sigma factor (sigma-70 family)
VRDVQEALSVALLGSDSADEADARAGQGLHALGGRADLTSEDQATALALQGERVAWDWLIERHQHRVVVALLARGVRMDHAREFAQEAWARLIQQQRKGALRELRLPSLAITQATYLALDEARRSRREGEAYPGRNDVEGLAEREQPLDPSASAEARLLSEEQLQRAHAALKSCSPGAQRVFRLVYEGPDLPHAEVAAQVGLSTQRVRQILCEVRKKLRAALEDESV